MKKIIIFTIVSILIHSVLLLVTFNGAKIKGKQNTPIEIVQKKPQVKTVEEPLIEPAPQPIEPVPVEKPKPKVTQPPKEIIPPTPKPPKDIPVVVTDQPSVAEGDSPKEAENSKSIVPKSYDPSSPPAPMTPSEFIKSQIDINSNNGGVGPDRQIPDIIRDNLQNKQYPAGEDGVSFNSMPQKYDSYFYRFTREIYNVWQYPADAAKSGQAGIVRVNFSISKDGKISNIELLESSGYPKLDREVLRTLKAMRNVPLPDSFDLNTLHINGYFIYSLDGQYRIY